MNTTDKVSHFAQDAVEGIADVANHAKESFDEKTEQLANAEKRVVKNCQSYVRDNPVTSIGLAVAGGFILSRLLSGR